MARQFINPKTLKDDVTAGLVLGIESIPDGLAQGLLAAVNPIYGLYAYMMGTFSGAFFTSSVFMAIQATSAMSRCGRRRASGKTCWNGKTPRGCEPVC